MLCSWKQSVKKGADEGGSMKGSANDGDKGEVRWKETCSEEGLTSRFC